MFFFVGEGGMFYSGESEGLVSRPDRFNFEETLPFLPTDHECVVVARVRLDILGCRKFFSLRRPQQRNKVRV